MTAAMLTREDFEPHLGTDFVLAAEGGAAVVLTLEEATALGGPGSDADRRPPFSLMFAAGDPRVLPQALYLLRHETMGEQQIFLVPRSQDARGVRYEALFN